MKHFRIRYPGLVILLIFTACKADQDPLKVALSKGSKAFREIVDNPRHEVQIVYGRIMEDSIVHYDFNANSTDYFYPASTVKMLAAFAAAEYLEAHDFALQTIVTIDSQRFHPMRVDYDSLFKDKVIVENLIKKIFVYSDNDAYNVLFRILGKDYINTLYSRLGLDARIIHLLSESAFSFPPEANNMTYHHQLSSYYLPEQVDSTQLVDFRKTLNVFGDVQTWKSSLHLNGESKGRGYLDSNDTIVYQSFDFSGKNYLPLTSSLGALERVIKPSCFPDSLRFTFSELTRLQLIEAMDLLPKNLPEPIDTLPDNYVKFFWKGNKTSESIPESIHIYNKVGWAYGYLSDIAYFRDEQNGIEFFLAATIHVNENEIYNDGIYEYDEVGLPFLAELGKLVYEYELSQR